jgi:epoxyqueuosine reductase
VPEDVREALGDRVYGCDICQDVCPWNRGVEKRRAGDSPPPEAEPHVSLAGWLTADDDDLRERYDRLFVPRNDPRYLRRNALVAVGNGAGDPELARPYSDSDDPLLREHAEWALRRRA